MGFLFVLIATVGESIAKTIDKLNFSKNHITYRQSLLITFFGMTLSSIAFILLTKEHFPHLTLVSLGLVALIALFSFGGNIFDELSLKADDLSLREPMVDFEPILAGLVGYAVFPTERKPIFLLAFILAAAIVYWGSHRRRLGNLQKKGMSYLLLAAVLYAFLPSIYQATLPYVSPAYILFFRVVAILILLAIFLPVRKISKLSHSKVTYASLSAVLYAVEAIVSLYAIQKLGVELTMLLFMLGPYIRYLSSYFILKEQVRRGEVISSILLALIVAIAAFIS